MEPVLWTLLRPRGFACLQRTGSFRRHADGLAAPRRFLSNRLSLGRRLGPELARTDARDDHAVLGPDRGSAAAEIAEFYPATLGRADAPAGRAPHLSRLCTTI